MKQLILTVSMLLVSACAASAQAGPADPVLLYPDAPVLRAEISALAGEGLMDCGELKAAIRDANRVVGRIRKRVAEMNSLLERNPADPRLDGILADLEQLRRSFDEIYPVKQDFPTVTVEFSVAIPTLWPRERETLREPTMRDTILVEQMLLPEEERLRKGPFHSAPPARITCDDRYISKPGATLPFSFTRRMSMRELCFEQPRLRFAVTRYAHPWRDSELQDVRVRRESAIEASYLRLGDALKRNLRK